MPESGQDGDERGGDERGGDERGGVPAPPSEHRAHLVHLALLADGVVELRKRGGIAARPTGPEDTRDGGTAAGEAAGRDAHYAAGGRGSDPCLEAMARRAADRARRPRA